MMKTLNSLLLIYALFGLSSVVFSQKPFGVPYYSNCYQTVSGNLNNVETTFKFLNTTAGQTITFNSTNTLDIPSFEVSIYNDFTSDWDLLKRVNAGQTIEVSAGRIKILPLMTTTGYTAGATIIEFVDFDFEIISNTGAPPCLTFDNLNIKLNHNLSGLCMIPKITMKMPAGAVHTWGLGANYFKELIEDQNYEVLQDFCKANNNCLNSQSGNPVGCCMTFNFEITLKRCIGRLPEDCPDIKFLKQFEICCFCGEDLPDN